MGDTIRKIAVLEPYYGGSHRRFCDQLAATLPCTLFTLPPRNWKWRMRFAGLDFARRLQGQPPFPAVLASAYVDVALLRGCGPAWLRDARLVVYFHENQFAYPVQQDDPRDLHFAVTNLTSVLAADLALFNSQYNLDTFLAGVRDLLARAPDLAGGPVLEEVRHRCRVLVPGVDFQGIDAAVQTAAVAGQGPPLLVWNHRWEYDKDPERFFAAVEVLAHQGVEFGLAVLGRGFRQQPSVFRDLAKRFGPRLVHCGWLAREEYQRWLARGTVAVSTARHEFYGMAMLEAVRAGCRPLVPDDLAYREIFPAAYRYPRDAGVEELAAAMAEGLAAGRLAREEARRHTAAHEWQGLATAYRRLLLEG